MKKDLIRKTKSILIDIDSCLADEENFLKLVARKISKELEVKYIGIGRLISEGPLKIATEVFLENGREVDNIVYPVVEAPCANVIINRKVQLYTEGVADIFPSYLKEKNIESYIGAPILAPDNKLEGVLFLMDAKPIREADLMSSICEVLAVRIGADLELFKMATRLKEKSASGKRDQKKARLRTREKALNRFQENLARYQMLTERSWVDAGIEELVGWRKLHEQLKGNQIRLEELVREDSRQGTSIDLDKGNRGEKKMISAPKHGEGFFADGNLLRSFESDLMPIFLYKQNLRMLRSVRKILGADSSFNREKISRKANHLFEREETGGKASQIKGEKDFLESFSNKFERMPEAGQRLAGEGTSMFSEKHEKVEDFTTAFKVMMEQHKIIERDLCGAIKFNMEKIILPDLEKLQSKLNKKQQALCQVIATNIVEITEPLLPSTRTNILNKLSPSELRVINLIKQGHNTKEIGQILNLSPQTVATHRRNIRKKMGLTNQKENLFTVLNQS